jgi:hypothetical protein
MSAEIALFEPVEALPEVPALPQAAPLCHPDRSPVIKIQIAGRRGPESPARPADRWRCRYRKVPAVWRRAWLAMSCRSSPIKYPSVCTRIWRRLNTLAHYDCPPRGK